MGALAAALLYLSAAPAMGMLGAWLALFVLGLLFPSWGARHRGGSFQSPLDAPDLEHRIWWSGADVVVNGGGRITQFNDKSGFNNHGTVPAGVAGATAPLYLAEGPAGLAGALFDGITDAISRSSLVWGSDGGPLCAWWLLQRRAVTSSTTIGGKENVAPFLRTNNAGCSFRGAGAVGTTASESLYGLSMVMVWIDPVAQMQYVAVDGVVVASSPNTTGVPVMNNRTWGLCYNGHPTTGSGYTAAFVQEHGLAKGVPSASTIAKLTSWAHRQATPLRGWIEHLVVGQSNGLSRDVDLGILQPRRDLKAARYNTLASGPTVYDAPYGDMGPDFDAPLYRGFATLLAVRLREVLRIGSYLVQSCYSGCGFYTSGGAVDLMIPPSRNGGTAGSQFTRIITTVQAARSASAQRTASVLTIVHGETDALSTVGAPLYAANLLAFIADLEAELGAFDRIVIVRLSDGFDDLVGGTRRVVVQAAQDAVAVALGSRCKVVNMNGIPMNPDDTHFSDEGHEHIVDEEEPEFEALAA